MNNKYNLIERVKLFDDLKIGLVGDVMLDRSEYGSVVKVSAEAPCLVLRNEGYRDSPGGAGNVFANISSLGGKPYLCGVSGTDEPGDALRVQLLSRLKRGVNQGELDCFFVLPDRITSVKRRTYAQSHYSQQTLRMDFEDTSYVDEREIKKMIKTLESRLGDDFPEIFVFSDYGKGLLSPDSVGLFSEFLDDHNVKRIVDPKPIEKNPELIRKYHGAFGFKPNDAEASVIAGLQYNKNKTRKNLKEIGERCMDILQPEGFLLITLGDEGMFLYFPDGREEYISPVKVDVADITGAGDTVLAALALSLAAKANISDAAHIANIAASRKVTKRGTASVSKAELLEAIGNKSCL